jgi:hypothetical protein
MKKILVSLVSDQTVPNILAIHHFRPDSLLFISTKEMERKKKTAAILASLRALSFDYDGNTDICEVVEDSVVDCHRKLDKWIEGKEEAEFIVNLTGGTKIMSIAAYEFFKDYINHMIYIPIGRNDYITVLPKKAVNKPQDLGLRLSVTQYLTAYGLTTVNHKKLNKYREEASQRAELSEWLVRSYESIKNLLVWLSGNLRKHRDDDHFDLVGTFLQPSAEERILLDRFNFSYENDTISRKLSRSEIRYLTGGWLEEFCFNEANHYCGNGIDDLVLGLKLIGKTGRDNEFDVMFTKENVLYFIECKTLDQQNLDYKDILYKIGALQKEFGLRVKSFWVTTSPAVLKDNKLRPAVASRAEQFSTVVIGPGEVAGFGKKLAEELMFT